MNRLLRNIFLRNWGLKLFSFLLAVVIWFILIPEEKMSADKIVTVPLELHNIPQNMEVVEKPDSPVNIRIRAPRRLINDITPANVHAVLDLQDVSVEETLFLLNINMTSIPPGAEVIDISPGQVNLKLEMIREVVLDVEPSLIGNLQEGFILEKTEVIPPKVRVKGPESKISDEYKVKTSPVDISSFTETTDVQVDLILPNPDLKLVSSNIKVILRLTILTEQTEEEKKKD
jgi:YbbR domain-containing protein